MTKHVCDLCGEPAVITFEIYKRPVGHRPLFGLHEAVPRMHGTLVDLCAEHGEPVALVYGKGKSS